MIGRLKGLTGVALLLLCAGGAAAQDVSQIRLVLESVFALDHAACVQSLEARRLDFAKVRQVTSSGYQMLDHAFEGHNLACEAARIDLEIDRMQERLFRLKDELIRPQLGPNRPAQASNDLGSLHEEIADLTAHVIKLDGVTKDLRKAAEGMLDLAITDLDLLSKTGRDSLMLALDVQSQNDILCRMLGCPQAENTL
jgi:hypothetical protein